MLRELLIGLFLGTFTGLTPGIHVNTLAGIESSFAVLLAMGLTHTFLDAFPSTFLGVPDEGTALGILPAHRLVLAGKGPEVLRIALLSSLLAVVFTIPLLPLYSSLAARYSPSIGKAGALFLLAFLLLGGRDRAFRVIVIMALSGALGWAVLNGTNLREPFYHLFTGLFGIPVMIASLRGSTSLPEQDENPEIEWEPLITFSIAGTLLGMISSLLPAFTASIGATIATLFSRDERGFLAAVYSINTSNFLFGIINYLITGRTRNGIAVALSKTGTEPQDLAVILTSALLIGSLAVLLGLAISKPYLRIVTALNYRLLNAVVVLFLLGLSLYFDGLYGLWALLTASAIGYLAQELGVRRTNCMAVLIVPLLIR
ncbi:tripartite tricarboxylate transporter permease [Thermococcus sp. AM4]|uniref:tripartite tricarboxylate transporter permease n=1 Tax=Thermococcus sp. (strain AM4) TaxID=246969 RepID=UPI000186FC38|nr:tripartite tricarboxylate transporter permease [Thermococcus sp. AM4]EEB74889.1 integral membrane protein [Thermococcus sp. AM4]